jgi:predicted transcriptional regulator
MPYSFRRFLEEITIEKAPGPSTTFSIFHVLLAIEFIAEKPIGRNKLAKNLKVGEGAIRTIIDRLKEAELIMTSRAGCALTKKGLSLWKEYTSVLKKIEIGKSELTNASHNYAVLIRNQGHQLKSGMEQRDAAVMAGAKSATTIVYKEGRLTIPSVSDNVAKDFPKATTQINKLLKPEEKDVVIVVGADSSEKAKHSALAAAWTLLDSH